MEDGGGEELKKVRYNANDVREVIMKRALEYADTIDHERIAVLEKAVDELKLMRCNNCTLPILKRNQAGVKLCGCGACTRILYCNQTSTCNRGHVLSTLRSCRWCKKELWFQHENECSACLLKSCWGCSFRCLGCHRVVCKDSECGASCKKCGLIYCAYCLQNHNEKC
jgi:hypothetical protein